MRQEQWPLGKSHREWYPWVPYQASVWASRREFLGGTDSTGVGDLVPIPFGRQSCGAAMAVAESEQDSESLKLPPPVAK